MIRLAIPILLLAAVAVAAPPADSVPPDVLKARLAVKELETRLRDLEQKQAGLGKQRETLEMEMSVASMRVREAEEESRAAKSAVDAAAQAAAASQSELDRAMEQLRVQVSMLAVLGRSGLAPLLLHAIGSATDVPQRVTVALAVFREQKRRRDLAAALMAERAAALAGLSRRREELAGAARSVAQRRQELEQTRGRVVAELARLEEERRSRAVALAGAREDEERLERLWGAVTQAAGSEGTDVRLLRGGLRWPVESPRIVQLFGPHRDPQYGTVTVSHGLVLSAESGSRVSAVAAGRISYAQFFKGYGNLVIVQHGGEIYSLYARLASMLVRAGQRVGMGDPLGVVGREEGASGNFYLEIRVGQSAQDPLGWLKPIGK